MLPASHKEEVGLIRCDGRVGSFRHYSTFQVHLALGIVACLLPDGRRAWANTRDPDLMKAMTVEELCGHDATLHAGGAVEVA